ncbi:MAG: hypothetical protein ACNS60_02165 [Candidatus Cyclobacteriaceae bacterium M2_1C_046]
MRTLNLNRLMLALLMVFGFGVAQAQVNKISNFRDPGQGGINVFEVPKDDTVKFDGLAVRVGGDFAMQFQAIDQYNNVEGELVELGSNLNLPTANLKVDVQLAEGMRLHMATYLSSRNHTEAWVKGGYVQIDKLDFIKPGFASQIMDYTRFRFGMDDVNYGDAHYRRSDNARAIYNPFVGNYIMDAFTTEPFAEVQVLANGFVGVLGVTNGKLNQNVVVNDDTDNTLSLFGKIGYDKQVNEDLRVRLTGSWYKNSGESTGGYLFNGDRAGARYYNIMYTADGGSFADPRFSPRFKEVTAFQINPFIKFRGLEFFGIYETTSNSEEAGNGQFTQLAGELIYRFGANEDFYVGGRYNTVNGKKNEIDPELSLNRFNVGGGWFITNNVMTKVEYVSQNWEGSGWTGKYAGAGFDGFVVEAVISF